MSKFIEPSFVNETFMAVDIGLKGGIVYNEFDRLVIEEMKPDLKWLWGRIQAPQHLVAENVYTMPKQGIVSAGTLMEAKGIIRGMCAAADIEPDLIQPLKWIEVYTLKRRKHFDDKPQWKKHLLQVALEICPETYREQINLKTCDAFLIWNWAAARHTGVELSAYKQLTFK